MPARTIKRRFVLLGGYYPVAANETRRKLKREYARYLETWGVSGTITDLTDSEIALSAQIRTHGPGWDSDVQHHHFFWDDLIAQDRARSWLQRLPLAITTLIDFLRHGALQNYFRTAWRYAMFFLYPFVLLTGLLILATVLANFLLPGLGLPHVTLWRWPAGLALFAIALPVVANRLHLDHLVDDWIYARRIIHQGDRAVEARLAVLAADLAQNSEHEIVIVGHSFGAVHAVSLINRIRAIAPDGPAIRFASVGSSILKIALHNGAHAFRSSLATLAQSKNVIWRDIYAVNDYMNFCDADPVRTLKLPGTPSQTLKVQFRGMVSPEFYKTMELNYFRLHSQFICANDRRAPYDYFMLMCGPLPLEIATRDRKGYLTLLDEKASVTDEARRAIAGDSQP